MGLAEGLGDFYIIIIYCLIIIIYCLTVYCLYYSPGFILNA